MPELTDQDLVNNYLNGQSQQTFTLIYHKYHRAVYRFVFSRVGNVALSEDITSEVFFTLIKVLANYNGRSSLKTFILGIAFNKLKQALDQHKALPLLLSDHELELLAAELTEPKVAAQDEAAAAAITKLLPEIMRQLPDNYRQILQERYLNAASIKEVSQKLNLSITNVTTLQQRALAKARSIAIRLIEQNEANHN